MKFNGHVISDGIAYGRVGFLSVDNNLCNEECSEINQIHLLDEAIKKISDHLDVEIVASKQILNDRISEIFETHKYIVNDPILISKSYEYIKQKMSAKAAYKQAVKDILSEFEKIDNEYMLGRIVDIIDATDQVKVALKSINGKFLKDFSEPTILMLNELKPSIIYKLSNTNVVGFISEKGFYHQHSGIIARTIQVPGIVCDGIFEKVTELDYIRLDCNKGTIELNPETKEDTNEL